jgi:hypothetical protein
MLGDEREGASLLVTVATDSQLARQAEGSQGAGAPLDKGMQGGGADDPPATPDLHEMQTNPRKRGEVTDELRRGMGPPSANREQHEGSDDALTATLQDKQDGQEDGAGAPPTGPNQLGELASSCTASACPQRPTRRRRSRAFLSLISKQAGPLSRRAPTRLQQN